MLRRQAYGYVLYLGALLILFPVLPLLLLLGAFFQLSVTISYTVFIIYVIFVLPTLVYYANRLTASTAEQKLQRDPRPPVLYLRSFSDDKGFRTDSFSISLKTTAFGTTLEERLAEAFGAIGPVIAMGRPGSEDLPFAGAARLYVIHTHWKEEVEGLIKHALAIVYLLGETPGARWEFRRMIELGAWGKLILVFPPTNRADLASRWRKLCTEAGDAGGLVLPAELTPDAVFGIFTVDGHLRILRSPNMQRDSGSVQFGLSCYTDLIDEVRRLLTDPGRRPQVVEGVERPGSTESERVVRFGGRYGGLGGSMRAREPAPAWLRNVLLAALWLSAVFGGYGVFVAAQGGLDSFADVIWLILESAFTGSIVGGVAGAVYTGLGIAMKPVATTPSRTKRALAGGVACGICSVTLCAYFSIVLFEKSSLANKILILIICLLVSVALGLVWGFATDQE